MHAMNYTRLIRREKAAYWNKNAKANRERPRHPFAPWIRHWQWLVWGHPVGMQVSRKRVVHGAQCKDLDRLNERLDELDARQQRQLSELRDAVDTTRTQSPCRPEPPTTVDQRHLPDLRVESVAHSSRYTALLWIAQLLAYPGGCGVSRPLIASSFFQIVCMFRKYSLVSVNRHSETAQSTSTFSVLNPNWMLTEPFKAIAEVRFRPWGSAWITGGRPSYFAAGLLMILGPNGAWFGPFFFSILLAIGPFTVVHNLPTIMAQADLFLNCRELKWKCWTPLCSHCSVQKCMYMFPGPFWRPNAKYVRTPLVILLQLDHCVALTRKIFWGTWNKEFCLLSACNLDTGWRAIGQWMHRSKTE